VNAAPSGVIKSFGDRTTEDVFHGRVSARARKIGADVLRVALRKLDMLNAAKNLRDLEVPPGNRLEALKGELRGSFSIRINDQFRVVFRWDDGAHDVRITDYH
jgi:proteic killer suppression protein